MIEAYKKAFIAVDGLNDGAITISAPSTIASVNAFYGALDANKVANMMPPGFLQSAPEKYIKRFDSKTVFIFDSFLSDELIDKLYAAGVRNLIITSAADYMSPTVKLFAKQKGMIRKSSFADEFVKAHKVFPAGMEVLNVSQFADIGRCVQDTYSFAYEENRFAMRFLTGATTSHEPKCVKLSTDSFAEMCGVYERLWFDFQPKERLLVLIPLFYTTGTVHGLHMGLIEGMTLVYQPKYDRYTFGKDLLDSKAQVALVAPSHVATLDEADLADGSLGHVKYLFVGGEAINPAQMAKFRKTAKRLGIQYILNGYGMTELGGMAGISDPECNGDGDVTISPVPGVKFRVMDAQTGEEQPDNVRGVLEVSSPCATLGYYDEAKNTALFTADGWIHTGDIAVRHDNGRYRVFGRDSDYFVNGGKSYAMFDIEEKVLELEEVSEAEVIKFKIGTDEQPAVVAVLKQSQTPTSVVLEKICSLCVPGMVYLLGIKFIENFKTNPVTSKRDSLSLYEDTKRYYTTDGKGGFYCVDVGGDRTPIAAEDVRIIGS